MFAGSGKGEVSRDRSRKNNRLEMKRTSSAAQVLDSYDEPQKEEYAYPRAKSHVSSQNLTHTLYLEIVSTWFQVYMYTVCMHMCILIVCHNLS